MTKRIAIIDLGTNTFNLLVADKNGPDIERIYSTKEGVALGLGGINEKRLSADAIERAMAALHKYADICKNLQTATIHAFGTSALRNATNANELVELAKKELDIHIEIIGGEREAELIYKGVRMVYDFNTPGLIMDIGGGSTEFIWANSAGVKKSRSFEIGVSRIYQMRNYHDPLNAEDELFITSYLDQYTGNFFDDIACKRLIGASGSFETFYKLAYSKEFPDHELVTMPMSDVVKSLDHIISSTLEERNANPLIIPIRKIMAPMAAVKTKWIIHKLEMNELVISPFALKEGVMSEL